MIPAMSIKLRPFQERVYTTLLEGQSVILQAPTGAGKTWAALYPFFENLAQERQQLPLTCRYAVPMRVLARQFYNEFHPISAKLGAYNDNLRKAYKQLDMEPIAIQTGEQPDDPQFEAALTFCTIDQLLASALGVPYSIGGRRANLNVGAILSSYLVLDEFHLFPYEKGSGARITTLELLRRAQLRNKRPLVPFVLMTATFSSQLLKQLAEMLGARVVSVLPDVDQDATDAELPDLNAKRERIFYLHDAPLSAQAVLDSHIGSSLVVCNTVRRSQQIYHTLREQIRQEGRATTILLLHSRFTRADREWLQEQVEKMLGQHAWQEESQRDVIIVATQVVEVGLDISATRLHTELAPANSLIQRAGRCARFAEQQGEVHVYPLADDAPSFPYATVLCDATRTALAAYSGQHLSFAEEQQLIDTVHAPEDHEMLKQLQHSRNAVLQHIVTGWCAAQDRIGALRSELIRDVQHVSVIIHPDPKAAITERPWQWESFSLHPGSLAGAWDALAAYWDQHGDGNAFCHKPIAYETAAEAGERLITRYDWEPVTTQDALWTTPMVVLPPLLATYDSPKEGGGLGFLLRDGKFDTARWPSTDYPRTPTNTQGRSKAFGGYEQESYVEHITQLLRAYQSSYLLQQLRYPAQVLEEVLGLPAGYIDRAVRLAIACHDIGKLGTNWQRWCEQWQTALAKQMGKQYAIQASKQPFAHTDFDDSQEQRALQHTIKPKRPNHACESAALAAFFIEETLLAGLPTHTDKSQVEALARATVAAIAHHHTATAKAYSPITLTTSAMDAIRAGLDVVRAGQGWSYDLSYLDCHCATEGELTADRMTVPSAEKVPEALLYFVLVRVLRLADQRSLADKA